MASAVLCAMMLRRLLVGAVVLRGMLAVGAASCDLFEGSWLPAANHSAYPPYNSSTCPFIGREFDCMGNGRRDRRYLSYAWQPTGCNLPRFNGKEFLNKHRGKRIMFVGDSLSRNQWTSFVCMLHAAAPDTPTTVATHQSLTTLTFTEYEVRVMLHHTVYLVDVVRKRIGRVLKLDSLQGGRLWRGADMLIFNTWHWWGRRGFYQPWDYIQDGANITRDMNRLAAFQKALATWAEWVNTNANPARTQVFFQGISPSHYNGVEWEEGSARTCRGETEPTSGTTYPGGTPAAVRVVKHAVRATRGWATLLDITTLSQLRKDGHPSVYGLGHGSDCSHWCLPGVPDTWNEILGALAR